MGEGSTLSGVPLGCEVILVVGFDLDFQTFWPLVPFCSHWCFCIVLIYDSTGKAIWKFQIETRATASMGIGHYSSYRNDWMSIGSNCPRWREGSNKWKTRCTSAVHWPILPSCRSQIIWLPIADNEEWGNAEGVLDLVQIMIWYQEGKKASLTLLDLIWSTPHPNRIK